MFYFYTFWVTWIFSKIQLEEIVAILNDVTYPIIITYTVSYHKTDHMLSSKSILFSKITVTEPKSSCYQMDQWL